MSKDKVIDLYCAVALETAGFKIQDIVKNHKNGKMIFFFEDSLELQATKKDYYDRKLKLIPQEIFHNLKYLKGQIYNSSYES